MEQTTIKNWKLWILKVVLAGFVAFIILNLVANFYYTPPAKIVSEDLATDFILERNYTSYIRDEGFAKFETDENGYNNSRFPEDGKVDVLIMGSSHTLGYTVNQQENLSYLLQKQLDMAQMDLGVYNIAMWGHTWYATANNFSNALIKFQPSDYVIMEIHDQLEYSDNILPKLIQHTFVRESVSENGLVSKLRKFPYFQLIMHQYRNAMNQKTNDKDKKILVEDEDKDISGQYKSDLEIIVQTMLEQMKPYKSKLVFYYIPHLEIREDGTTEALKNDYFYIFEEVAKEYGIIFIDMSEAFYDYYTQTYRLPFGFSNTKVGVGHLNKYGHQLVSEALFQTILQNKQIGGN